MPDLDIITMQQCASIDEKRIGGYRQTGLRSRNPKCSCKGFHFRKSCKHLTQALKQVCNYHEQIHGRPKVNKICPHCGGPTEYVRVGI